MNKDNWKSLMVTMAHWHCNDASDLLNKNGIETIKKSALMHMQGNPHEVYGVGKLMVNPNNYERGLEILHKHGFRSDKEYTDGALVEIKI